MESLLTPPEVSSSKLPILTFTAVKTENLESLEDNVSPTMFPLSCPLLAQKICDAHKKNLTCTEIKIKL